jgi:hypothetical protein
LPRPPHSARIAPLFFRLLIVLTLGGTPHAASECKR